MHTTQQAIILAQIYQAFGQGTGCLAAGPPLDDSQEEST